ncbi:MAG: sensor domain-containing diguanylate cyclase [Defluviitaleaceae bacterium]|nr:sensor domain-containing diguanylate cyclase [Defluviitaleaceae bacterium]
MNGSELAGLLLDASPMMIEVWDDTYKLIDCNRRLLDTFGLKTKEEYFAKYLDCLPEYQPCGTPSIELSDILVKDAFNQGDYRSDWMYRLPNGEELPVEVFGECITHGGKTVMVEYMKDMREVKASENLLSAVIKSAEALLTANKEDTLKVLMKGMEIVGRCLKVDRVQIWRNEINDGELNFVMRYEWLNDEGKKKRIIPPGLNYLYSKRDAWLEKFKRGESINGPLSELPPEEAAFIGHYEMLSIVCLPLFIDNELIGFFSVNDCTKPRTFTKDEMGIIASAGLMFTCVFNRNAQADLTLTDALTGVRNRRYIMEVMEQKFRDSIHQNLDFSVIMMDIDFFKRVNDQYGHVIGDEVLKIFAGRIKNSLKSDTIIARYGGEEFIVAFLGVSQNDTEKAAWRLNKAISSSKFVIEDFEVAITASFGVASKTSDTKTLSDVIINSDKALYAAKNAGRDTVVGVGE